MRKFLVALLLLPSLGFCDTKISAFPSTTTLNASDVIPVVTTPGTVPANKIITFQNFYTNIPSTITAASIGALTTSSATATYIQKGTIPGGLVSLSTGVTGNLSISNGGTGTSSPNLIAGTNITSITGTWPNQTINAATQSGGVSSSSGSIVQIVSSNTVSISSITSTIFADTYLGATITPKSTSDIIVIHVTGQLENTGTQTATATLSRGEANLLTASGACSQGVLSQPTACPMVWVDTGPLTSGATTYRVQVSTGVWGATNQTQSMVLEEINPNGASGGSSSLPLPGGGTNYAQINPTSQQSGTVSVSTITVSSQTVKTWFEMLPNTSMIFDNSDKSSFATISNSGVTGANTLAISASGGSGVQLFTPININGLTSTILAVDGSGVLISTTVSGSGTSLLSSTNTWTGGNTFTSSVTVAGAGNGKIVLNISGSTYTVTSSSVVPVTANYVMWSSTNGTLMNGGVAGVGVTAASTTTWTGSNTYSNAVNISSNLYVSNNGSHNAAGSMADVYKNGAASSDVLFSVGSSNQVSQLVVKDQQPLDLEFFGARAGNLFMGLSTGLNQITSNQNANKWELYNAGNMIFTTDNDATNDFIFKPRGTEQLRVSSLSGMTVASPMTVTSSATFNGTVAVSSGLIAGGSAGTSGQFLKSNGAGSIPSWATASGGSGGSSTITFQVNGTNYSTNLTTMNFVGNNGIIIAASTQTTGFVVSTFTVDTSYLNTLYPQLVSTNTYSAGAKQTVAPSATEAGLRVSAGNVPSTNNGGDIIVNNSGKFAVNDGGNWNYPVTFPISGTGAATLAANQVFAGPASGAAAFPGPRALVANDINSGTNADSSHFLRGDFTWVSSSTFGGGGGSPANYWVSGSSVGIGPTSFTPTTTLELYDASATPGLTSESFRMGSNDTDNSPIINFLLNNGSAFPGAPALVYETGGPWMRLNIDQLQVAGSFVTMGESLIGNGLSIGQNAPLGFNINASYGSPQAEININSPGTLEVDNATIGNYGGLIVSTLSVVAPITSTYAVTVSTPGKSFLVAITTNSHYIVNGTSPTISSCGTNPSVIGNDQAGAITIGGGSVTACTLTFAHPYGSGCTVIPQENDTSTTVTADFTSVSNTAITFGFSATLGGGTVWYSVKGVGVCQ